MKIKQIKLIQYIDEDTHNVEGVDIIGIIKGSSLHIASIRDFHEALRWTQNPEFKDIPVDIDYDEVQYHGDTPVYNLYESELYKKHAVS